MPKYDFLRALASVWNVRRQFFALGAVVSVRRRMARVPAECWVALVLSAAPVFLRTVLLVEQSLPLGPSDVHGYLSDVTISALVAAALSTVMRLLSPRARTWPALVIGLAWTLIQIGNYEHISALGAPLQFTYAQYMRDGVFVAGSALSISSAALLVILLVISVGGMLAIARQSFTGLSWQARAIIVLALAFSNAAWPTDPRALAWRDSNFMELLIRPSNAKALAVSQRTSLPITFRPNIAADLEGDPILPLGKAKRNVLLVILEGISGGNIPSLAAAHGIKQDVNMPALSAIAEKYVSFPTFLTNQRQTNRGEFALLCGRLDYLISGTSRMTEYARNGGEPCLPRILAEQGYRTLYAQPAPLSFMMKDQFMAKAGFTDVHGPELFPKWYARTSWGVDDRAFFEQAAKTISELNTSGNPWFATLLTVGTHHPYTVPESFKTGTAIDSDARGRAVRYLDQAVSAFVAELERSGVLDNTLLLITSDESFGVEGYDDVTKLLSYNWGFLIARAPGESPRVVSQPYAQVDVALTIADYLGISHGPFVGRSLFREYEDSRTLVFANTYQQKVYWSAAPNILECDEALTTCTKHVSAGPGLFSTRRASSPAAEADIRSLRDMLTLTTTQSARDVAGRTPLMLDNAAVWEVGAGHQNLVFAGQYFTLGADDELVVSLDATLDGPGAALILDSDVYSDEHLYEVFPPPLYDGDRVRFEYAYAPGKALNNVEVRLQARKHAGKPRRLIMKNAEMRVRRRSLARPGGVTTNFQVERASPHQIYFLGSGTLQPSTKPAFSLHPCVIKGAGRDFLAKGCDRGALVYGPYAKVAAGSDLRATFDVASLHGAGKFRSEIASEMGQNVFGSSPKPINVPENSSVPIVVDARVNTDVEGLEARLVLMNADAGAEFVIRRAVLEVNPP